MEDIRVSIITVCYNSELTIERTILSVLNQTYSNIEYIIVDGKSTDRTLEIVEKYRLKYEDRIKVISEPDDGIYDAMNKGISHATGELIGIINSDDYYEIEAVESAVMAMCDDKYQVIYGMLRELENNIEVMVVMPKHENLSKTMIAHPTCFVTKNIYDDFGMFNTQYKSCADYDFMLRIRKYSEVIFVPIYKILATFTLGTGISAQESSIMETMKMLKNHGLISKRKYQILVARYGLKKYLKRLARC